MVTGLILSQLVFLLLVGKPAFVLAGFSKLLILKKLVIPARVQVQLKFARFCVSQAWERRKRSVHFSLLNGLVTETMKKAVINSELCCAQKTKLLHTGFDAAHSLKAAVGCF